jgi:hypothetical protein
MLCVSERRELDMAAKEENGKPVDPLEAFRGMRDAYLASMSKVMINAVNSEEYAQASGALLDGSLTLSAPFREALDKAMIMALEQLSMPSRQQVTALAERFTNLEMRLDDVDAKLDRIIEFLSVSRPTPGAAAPGKSRPAASGAKLPRQAGKNKSRGRL